MPEPFIQSLVRTLAGPECLVETYRETYQTEEKPTFLTRSADALARFGIRRQVQP